MVIIDKNNIPDVPTVVALGIFDGVHLGHRRVITGAGEYAAANGALPAVFTFKTSTVTTKGRRGAILTDSDKLAHFAELGTEYVFIADFADLRELSPARFVRKVLHEQMHASAVVCGQNFHFGKGGTAGSGELSALCAGFGMKTIVVPPFLIDGERVSTTRIRELVKSGGISVANSLLGYRFYYELEVSKGAQLGRTWDFPTINQQIPAELLLPRFGVYCVKVIIDGREYPGVCNVGIKPTIGRETLPLAETFILGFSGDLYGKTVRTEFYEFVRPEMRFAGFEDLKAEIRRNTEFARQYFEN